MMLLDVSGPTRANLPSDMRVGDEILLCLRCRVTEMREPQVDATSYRDLETRYVPGELEVVVLPIQWWKDDRAA